MSFSFAKALSRTYSEISQVNPLRWEILYRDGNNFIPQTGKIKCKDFFNDIVSKKNDYTFTIYGFNSTDVLLNKEGLYVRLTSIADMDQFIKNVEKVINTRLKADLQCSIWTQKIRKSSALLFIPNELFGSTYLISLVTYLIRLCNYGKDLEDFNTVFDSVPAITDNALNPKAKALAKAWGFGVPEQYKEFWYYAGSSYNSKTAPSPSSSVIHNNGVCNWASYITI